MMRHELELTLFRQVIHRVFGVGVSLCGHFFSTRDLLFKMDSEQLQTPKPEAGIEPTKCCTEDNSAAVGS